MNILLISPNTLTVPYPVYPIGLDYVAGAIPEEHEVRIADMHTAGWDDLAAVIKDFSPALIGISCRNIDNTEAGDPLFLLSGYQHLVAWLRRAHQGGARLRRQRLHDHAGRNFQAAGR